jgi:hypothetical protein
MDTQTTCRYCQRPIVKGGREHVFPKGLGGPNLYMDNVCGDCNKKFSDYERALMRDSPVALMRSVEGVEGYQKSGRPSGTFSAPIMFSFDESTNVVYEIGQRHPLQNFVRPQVTLINGAFYIDGENNEEVQKFVAKFNHWKKDCRYMVVKIFSDDTASLQWIEFTDTGTEFTYAVSQTVANKADAIKIDILRSDYELYPHLTPRIFVNDLGELWIRARTFDEATSFLAALMNNTREKIWMNKYSTTFNHPVIYVGQSFNNLQFSQGLIKVGLNCLMHFYPGIKDSAALNPCITFVMTGREGTQIDLEEKDNLKDSTEGTHNIFFQQTTHGMNIRISFFNGAGGAFSFYVLGLMVLKPGEFNRLVIDYTSHTMDFQDRAKFLRSFDKHH